MITAIWLVFTLVFAVLTVKHWKISRAVIASFQIPAREGYEHNQIVIKGVDLDKPVHDLADSVNRFINELNSSNRKQNQLQALGYFAASLTALVSMILSTL